MPERVKRLKSRRPGVRAGGRGAARIAGATRGQILLGRVPAGAGRVPTAGWVLVACGALASTGVTPAVARPQPPTAYLFVANPHLGGADSVTEYVAGANGDVAPIATISGSSTGLSHPFDVAVDGAGDLFAANQGTNSVTEYGPGANGNATPMATITGPAATFSPGEVAVGGSGDLFVGSGGGDSSATAASVLEYAPGANGNATPIATISGPHTGLGIPNGVAVDASGDVFVTNFDTNSVVEFAPGAHGDATPIATISGTGTGLSEPIGLAVDGSGDVFVANNGSGSVTEYAPGAHGGATPIATISGPHTGLNIVNGVAVDGSGDLFVTNDDITFVPDPGCVGAFCGGTDELGGGSVIEFAKGVNGDATPIATITGPHTGLNGPTGLTVATLAARPTGGTGGTGGTGAGSTGGGSSGTGGTGSAGGTSGTGGTGETGGTGSKGGTSGSGGTGGAGGTRSTAGTSGTGGTGGAGGGATIVSQGVPKGDHIGIRQTRVVLVGGRDGSRVRVTITLAGSYRGGYLVQTRVGRRWERLSRARSFQGRTITVLIPRASVNRVIRIRVAVGSSTTTSRSLIIPARAAHHAAHRHRRHR